MNFLSLAKELTKIGVQAPFQEAADLVCFYLGKSREWCMMNQSEQLPDEFGGALEKRRQGIPIQYILGETWFYGYRFKLSDACLIPQPDTEHVVALALSQLRPGAKLLDLCTGSGCIPISVLNETDCVTATALDISDGALSVAIDNCKLYNLSNRLTVTKADVLVDDISTLISEADVITSNPPYISTSVIPTLSAEVRHEPIIALDGGPDGMIFYSHFIGKLTMHMKDDAVMILELGYDQSDRIMKLCSENGLDCRLYKDFGGNIRVAEIRKKTKACIG